MKTPQTLSLLAAAITCAALLAAQAVTARDRDERASTLRQVNAIWLDSNSCHDALDEELEDNEFALVSSSRFADAVLKVNVHELDARMGASARYTATLSGENGRPLFTTSGREDSHSYEELCEDISEEIVDRLENRMG